jgi:hypothetical protein
MRLADPVRALDSDARRIQPATYACFFVIFALIVYLTHAPFFGLPFFWDEVGQFIPAALDIYAHGEWVPHAAVPNVHPPGVMAYLAGVWHLAGYSVEATRLAMLLLASFSVLVVFLVAIRLLRPAAGAPAFAAVALLVVSPLFYTQAMMAQLDLAAMLFTAWVLLLFLEDRWRAAALVSIALVLVKETGAVVPVVLGAWLVMEKRTREAAWFVLPLLALCGWLAVLRHATGHVLGSASFTAYNLFYPLHPVRLGVAVLRRVYFLGLGDFHWIGMIAVVVGWRAGIYANREWRIAGAVTLANVAIVTVLGGAGLERYLLPALPLVYIAMVAGWSVYSRFWRVLSEVALAGGLLLSLFWNPPFPFPYENNLAMTDSIYVQRAAASYIEQNLPGEAVTTVWPLSAALQNPKFGYVSHEAAVREIPNFAPSTVKALAPERIQVFVLYSATWNPAWNLLHNRTILAFAHHYYKYEPDIAASELQRWLGVSPTARWERHGQWAEVYVAPWQQAPGGQRISWVRVADR